MSYTRYPRTPHVPWSPGASTDDVRHGALSCFDGEEVVVTEKLDGENTSLYRDHLHARSPDSAHHPSRAWIKRFHDRVRGRIPEGHRVSGESLYARHSIAYEALESWFYVFSVWDRDDVCLDWDATTRFARRLGAPTPRVLYRGRYDEKAIRALEARLDLRTVEGYVIRAAGAFARGDFDAHVAKWVRKDHVQTDVHWMHGPVVPNGLGAGAVLWEARSGDAVTAAGLLGALGSEAQGPRVDLPHLERRLGEALQRIDELGRTGDARLEGALAALFEGMPRAELAARARKAGPRVARRAADLVGLVKAIREPFPDEQRLAGLRRMARAVDLGVLHAVARTGLEGAGHEDVVLWSEIHAGDAGLLSPAPLARLRADASAALAELPRGRAQKAWSGMLDRFVAGTIASAEEGVQATFRERSRDVPSLVGMVGPAGSGKTTLSGAAFPEHRVISLDDLRAGRGDRGDQSQNDAILRTALERLETALQAGESVVWDATLLMPSQRALLQSIARRFDALTTWIVFTRAPRALEATNRTRAHPVDEEVLAAQLRRYRLPYPGDADILGYVDDAGAIADTAGDLFRDELEDEVA